MFVDFSSLLLLCIFTGGEGDNSEITEWIGAVR